MYKGSQKALWAPCTKIICLLKKHYFYLKSFFLPQTKTILDAQKIVLLPKHFLWKYFLSTQNTVLTKKNILFSPKNLFVTTPTLKMYAPSQHFVLHHSLEPPWAFSHSWTLISTATKYLPSLIYRLNGGPNWKLSTSKLEFFHHKLLQPPVMNCLTPHHKLLHQLP